MMKNIKDSIARIFGITASKIKDMFIKNAPKVSCPKCGEIHDINSSCRCPVCGTKYKLPEDYRKYIEAAAKKEQKIQESQDVPAGTESIQNTDEHESERAMRETGDKRKRIKKNRIIKLAVSVAAISLFFLVFTLLFFRDKDALVFRVGEYKNQPVFYTLTDGTLKCAFPNDKGCTIGKGTLGAYISSSDGKDVYLTYTGSAFGTEDVSNYVIRISGYGAKIEKIAEDSIYLPRIVSGGDNKYLYIMTPLNDAENMFRMDLSIDGKKTETVFDNAIELAVSTSGRYALVSIDDSGASKLMLYSAAKDETINPGIKNAHPLSVDNRGEYLIYARKKTMDSTDIVVEKSTQNRVEIPLFSNDTELHRIIFSQDRRTFAVEYNDRTVVYSCGDDDYAISYTSSDSSFGYDFNYNVNYNILHFTEIPEVADVYGTEILPYFFFDNEHKYVYRITENGAKESVFDNYIIDELKVSENGKAAFTSGGMLYTGKLDKKNADICLIMNFNNKELLEISPDGKLVYYTDSDGNLFSTPYGKENTNPRKLSVDPDIIKCSGDGKQLITVSGGTTSLVDKKGNSQKLCDGIISEMTVVAKNDLSELFYVTGTTDNEGNEKRSLYLYSGKKAKLITDELDGIYQRNELLRFDVSKSSYIGNIEVVTENSNEQVPANAAVRNSGEAAYPGNEDAQIPTEN